MADVRHGRADTPTLATDCARESGSVPQSFRATQASVRAVLSVHFPGPESSGTAPVDSAIRLVTDFIQGSGGTQDACGAASVSASFPSLPLTVLIVRRLKWALDGLAVPNVAIIVQSESEALDSSLALRFAALGLIVLSPEAAAAVQGLPGLVLQELKPHDGPEGWRELVWPTASEAVNYADDEQSLLQLIRDCGREDPCPESAFEPAESAPSLLPDMPAIAKGAPSDRGLFTERRWLVLGGVCVALGLVIAVIALAVHRQPGTAGVASQPAARTPIQAQSSRPTARPSAPIVHSISATPPSILPPVAPEQRATHSVVPKLPPAVDKPAAAEQHSKKPADAMPCDFTESGVSRALARAETDMHDGQLEEAKAAFLEIRGCPSARDRIEEDLRIVQLKIEAQGLTKP